MDEDSYFNKLAQEWDRYVTIAQWCKNQVVSWYLGRHPNSKV